MSNTAENNGKVKEVIGVFGDAKALEAAVGELEISGFDRAAMSVLAADTNGREQVERFYRPVKQIQDSSRVSQDGFVSRHSRSEGEAAVIGLPVYVVGCAGAAAVAATGGALAFAISAALVGGAVGGGLGTIFAAAIARNHTADVQEQIENGGLVLWVNVPNADAEKRAVNVLNKMSARDVHVHEIKHEWGEAHSRPIQADPFLLEAYRS